MCQSMVKRDNGKKTEGVKAHTGCIDLVMYIHPSSTSSLSDQVQNFAYSLTGIDTDLVAGWEWTDNDQTVHLK